MNKEELRFQATYMHRSGVVRSHSHCIIVPLGHRVVARAGFKWASATTLPIGIRTRYSSSWPEFTPNTSLRTHAPSPKHSAIPAPRPGLHGEVALVHRAAVQISVEEVSVKGRQLTVETARLGQ